jgi:glucose/arabinose dehydrogenase/plastocyanin
MVTFDDSPAARRVFAAIAAVALALTSTGTVAAAGWADDPGPSSIEDDRNHDVGPVQHVQAVPEVAEGFTISELAPSTAPTVLAFGPGDTGGPDVYAAMLTGSVERYHLEWTPLGPVVEDVSTAADGFEQPLGVAFDDEGDMLVADHTPAGESDNAEAADRPLGKVVHVDAVTGETDDVVVGLPAGQHHTNHIRFGPDGLLYLPNGNPNDHGNGTGENDVFPYSGAFLAVDVNGVDDQLPDTTPSDPAILHWQDESGDPIADEDVVDHPRNEAFADQVRVFAHGFRNVFGIAFAPSDLPFAGEAFTAMNGADDPASQDAFYRITPGANHGFPFCYNEGDPGATGDAIDLVQAPDTPNPDRTCDGLPGADALMGWHTCTTGLGLPSNGANGPTTRGPVGFDFSFEGAFEQSAFVGECSQFFADSWIDAQASSFSTHSNSHKVARVALDDTGEATQVRDFVTGLALPTDVQFGPDGAMYVADAGAIYRVAPVPTPSQTPSGAPAPVAAVGQSFVSPVTVVPEGTTVQWTSGAIPHTVTTSDEQCVPGVAGENCEANGAEGEHRFDHRLSGGADQVSHTFTEDGVYPYFCKFHAQLGMTGTVVVVDPADPQASSQVLDEARQLLAGHPDLADP